jgi:hypothetical protein
MDLNEYEEKRRTVNDGRRKRCLTCGLSEEVLSQVHQGRARDPKPVSFETISKWLDDVHGKKIQPATLRNHFVAKHHDD